MINTKRSGQGLFQKQAVVAPSQRPIAWVAGKGFTYNPTNLFVMVIGKTMTTK